MLYKKLEDYCNEDIYPFHMPGHKRNGLYMPGGLTFEIDITEIPGFDDLHDTHGILLETSKLAAKVYKSRKAFILVNGTTVGILAAIGAHAKRGDKILTGSNCHWSTSNAAKLFGLEIIYINAQVDEATGVPCSISAKAIAEEMDKHPDIKMVVVTSPTYEGVISDIASIAKIVHASGALLLVDGAHGAHLGFSEFFPHSVVTSGADIAVISLHKTLPALTQCSLLHVCSERADTSAIKEMLSILQTSSPSYVLMASIDYCIRLLDCDSAKLFNAYEQNLQYFYNRVKNIEHLTFLYNEIKNNHIPGSYFFDCDPGKITIITKNTAISSDKLANLLRNKYKIETERKFKDYVIAMTSICDTKEGFEKLGNALKNITD